jgi:hypothetical protein
VGSETVEADREIAARKEEARVRRKRRLPAVPKGRPVSKLPESNRLADLTISEMVERIHNLEDINTKLRLELDDARAAAQTPTSPVDIDEPNR